MENLVSAYVDDKLDGVQKWYTESHLKGCKQCQASVPFLQALKSRTLMLGTDDMPAHSAEQCQLDHDRWEKIEKEWDSAEETVPHSD
jgi:hypothetical protein